MIDWLLILFNGILSFFGSRFVKLITLEINAAAIALIVLQGEELVLNAFLLTLIYVLLTLEEVFSLPPKFVATLLAGYATLLTGTPYVAILVYYAAVLVYFFFTGYLAPPTIPYILLGLLENYAFIKIAMAFMGG